MICQLDTKLVIFFWIPGGSLPDKIFEPVFELLSFVWKKHLLHFAVQSRREVRGGSASPASSDGTPLLIVISSQKYTDEIIR